MKCSNCGFENSDDAVFCSNCGAQLQQIQPVSQPECNEQQNTNVNVNVNANANGNTNADMSVAEVNPLLQRTLMALKDNLFLTVCILETVSCGLGLVSFSASIVSILFTIFLWLIYGKSKKNSVDGNNFRNISGTVFAKYIINWVKVGALVLSGISGVIIAVAIGTSGLWDHLISMLDPYIGNFKNYTFILTDIGTAAITATFIILILVAAGLALLNIFGTRSIHKFFQSLYKSIYSGNMDIINASKAKNWLLAFGIINGVSALSILPAGMGLAFLSFGSSAAAKIIASMIIGKYFIDNKYPVQ